MARVVGLSSLFPSPSSGGRDGVGNNHDVFKKSLGAMAQQLHVTNFVGVINNSYDERDPSVLFMSQWQSLVRIRAGFSASTSHRVGKQFGHRHVGTDRLWTEDDGDGTGDDELFAFLDASKYYDEDKGSDVGSDDGDDGAVDVLSDLSGILVTFMRQAKNCLRLSLPTGHKMT